MWCLNVSRISMYSAIKSWIYATTDRIIHTLRYGFTVWTAQCEWYSHLYQTPAWVLQHPWVPQQHGRPLPHSDLSSPPHQHTSVLWGECHVFHACVYIFMWHEGRAEYDNLMLYCRIVSKANIQAKNVPLNKAHHRNDEHFPKYSGVHVHCSLQWGNPKAAKISHN